MYSRLFTLTLEAANTGLASGITLALVDSNFAAVPTASVGAVTEVSGIPGTYYALASAIPDSQVGLAVWTVTGRTYLNSVTPFGATPATDVVAQVDATIATLPTGFQLLPLNPNTMVTVLNAGVVEAPLEFKRGTSQTIQVTVVDAYNSPVDITGASISFMVKQDLSNADSAALLTKTTGTIGGITITNAPSGLFTISILPADTDDTVTPSLMEDFVMYQYGVKLYSISGIESPILEGTFQILPFAVRSTSAPT